jgi:hypothetical protein
MSVSGASTAGLESTGLGRIATGSSVGLSAGIVGLALPVTLFLFAHYSPGTVLPSASELVQVTAILALAGAILFAISLTFYRWGFWSLQSIDRRFWVASVLCLLGTIGVVLVILPMAIAFTASGAMAGCIEASPLQALTCLSAAAPLVWYLGIAGVWLLWIGGLGVVVGIGLASVRYNQGWLGAGAGLYALLLLGLLGPILGLVFPIGGLVYPILALPLLVLIAPALISYGSYHSYWSYPGST